MNTITNTESSDFIDSKVVRTKNIINIDNGAVNTLCILENPMITLVHVLNITVFNKLNEYRTLVVKYLKRTVTDGPKFTYYTIQLILIQTSSSFLRNNYLPIPKQILH